MDFTQHRDAVCRQHAILALGNLCSEAENAKRLIDIKCTDVLVAFSFPPTTDGSINAQFQAIAGLHGLSKHPHLREFILIEGGLEPLILGARGNTRHADIEIQREATATISNLALEERNRLAIAKSGALPALVTLAKSSDTMCISHAITALANLAESSEEIHDLLISAQSIKPMCALAQNQSTQVDIKRAICRCFSLFASNADTHHVLLVHEVTKCIRLLTCESRDVICQRFGALTVSNLALTKANHEVLLDSKLLESVLLVDSRDIETLRGMAFALHSLSENTDNHAALERAETVESLIPLLRCGDFDSVLQACLAIKYLSRCDRCSVAFVQCNGLEPLLALSTSHDVDTKRELAATLRNLSLSDRNKVPIMKVGMDLIAALCRDADREVSHQACGIVANISEKEENKIQMVKTGVIHHLQAAISFSDDSIHILRESVRAFSGLSSDMENTAPIVASGALTPLISALNAADLLCRRFAIMALSNLAVNRDVHERIMHEVGMPLLMFIGRQGDRNFIDIKTQQYGMACLANLASRNTSHDNLMNHGCAELAIDHTRSSDLDLRRSALLLLANLASNKSNHNVLEKCCRLSVLIKNLECDDSAVQLHACSALRGLSTNISMRKQIIKDGGTEVLLALIHTTDDSLKVEILSTLCNLSLGGCMGDLAKTVMKKIDIPSLINFLCSGDSMTERMFGSVAIGNIASDINLHGRIFDSGAVRSLIELSGNDGGRVEESQRCMAYAICNLSAETQNRFSIITQGGLVSIIYLCHTGDISDMLAALSTLRGLSASADARRLIFEEGVLHALVIGVKSGNLQCKREVASILVNLSLNEDNKLDIAQSNEIEGLVSLLDEADVDSVSNTCRAFGNMTEVKELHGSILSMFTMKRLVHLSSPESELEVKREVTRCIANLSSNFDLHENLVQAQLTENLRLQCSNTMAEVQVTVEAEQKMDVIRLSALSLANLCMNEDNHRGLETKSLLQLFHNIVSWDVCFALSNDTVSEAKCSACMGLSALCSYLDAPSILIELGTIPSLIECIATGTHELSIYASFVISKLSMMETTHPEFVRCQVTTALVKNVSISNRLSTTYSIAAVRRLSDNQNSMSELIGKDTLDFLTSACTPKNAERSRELACSICHLALSEKATIPIAQSQMLDQIVILCDSVDVETSRFALGCLANLASDCRTHSMILKHPVVHQMLCLTQSQTISTAREATRVLANLLSTVSTHELFLKEGGMALLSCVCEVQDSECTHNASVVFRKLAANGQTHEAFFADESVNVVMNLMALDDTQTVLQGAAALRDISSNKEFQLAFVEAGGLKTALDLAASNAGVDIKIIALGIIHHLSISMPLKTKILQSGAVSIISRCIESSNNADLLYQCASSIANIAEHAQSKAELVQMGTLQVLASLSSCKCADVKQETSRAFSLLSSAPENVAAFDLRVLSTVVDLLTCREEETGRDSASVISNIACNDEKRDLIRQCNGVAPLIGLLRSPFESVQIISCRALSRLTDIEENKVSAYGGLGLLLNLSRVDNHSSDVNTAAVRVLVNLSTCAEHQHKIIHEGALMILKPHLTSKKTMLCQYTTMTLCNLTSHDSSIDHVARQVDLSQLIELMSDDNIEIRSGATMTVCNLASKHIHVAAILMAGGLTRMAAILHSCLDDGFELQRAALMALYNLSTYEPSHSLLAKEEAIKPVILACRSSDVLSRRFALLILSNVGCNDKTRLNATKGGGLQSAILALKDKDGPTVRFACVCLSNMANESTTQSQIIVHGGLPSLMALSELDDKETKECALMCLSNLAANESNHLPLMKQGAFKIFVDASSPEQSASVYHQFGLGNLTSNPEFLSRIGRGGGVRPLLSLAKYQNPHYQCAAISGLRRLALIRENRDRLISEGVVSILSGHSCQSEDPELQREVASCFCNLSLNKDHRLDITRSAIAQISNLSQSKDPETIRLSLGAVANLAEDLDTHQQIYQANVLYSALAALCHEDLDVKRESARVITNLLSSKQFHAEVVENGLEMIIGLSVESCDECRYLAAVSFRKLSTSILSHRVLINGGLSNILALTKVTDAMTRKHALATIRDLSANDGYRSNFFKNGAIAAMTELVKDSHAKEIHSIAIASLRHLSSSTLITANFSRSVLVKCVARCISWANDDMRCQIAGLLANLSEHRECHSTMIAQGVVSALGKLSYADINEVKKVSLLLCSVNA